MYSSNPEFHNLEIKVAAALELRKMKYKPLAGMWFGFLRY